MKALLDSIGDPVVALRKNLQIVYCNQAYADIINATVEELEGHNLVEALPQIRGTASYRAYLEVLDTAEPRQVKGKYGSRCVWERVFGTPWGIISVGEDITERERTEKLIESSLLDYRAVFEAVNDAVFIHDAYTGDILDVNTRAVEMFAYRREELLGSNMKELSSGQAPYTQEDFLQMLKKAFYSQVTPFEWEVRDRNGRLFWIQTRPRRASIGGEERLLTVVQDITEYKQMRNALHASDERYRELVDNANDMIYTHDLEGNFLAVNKAGERITGYWREELLKMNMEQLVAHDYLELLRAMMYRRKAKFQENTYELEIMNRYGERVILDIAAWPIYKTGKPIAIQGIARDITQRKLAEAALAAAQYDARLILDQFPDAVMAINNEGKVVLWNKAMEELTGCTAEEMLGKGDYEYGVPFYGTKRPLMVDVVLNPEEVKKYYSIFQYENYNLITEFDAPKLKGRGQYLWGTAAPLKDIRGNTIGAVESLREITEQRKTREAVEAKLKDQVKHLTAIIGSLGSLVLSCDTDARITFASDRAVQLLGYKLDDLVEKHLSEFITDESRSKVAREILDHLPSGVEGNWDISIRRQDGSPLITGITVKPLRENGKVTGAIFLLEGVV